MRLAAKREPHESVVTVRVTAAEYASLVTTAQEMGDSSVGSVVRLAIREFLKAEKMKRESVAEVVKSQAAAL